MMRYIFLVILFIFPLCSQAVEVAGLYSARLAVEDQSPAVRKAAIRLVLNKVVQKVSGRRSVLADTGLQAALSNTGSYVEQFQYKKRDDDESAFWLIVSFQKAALDKVLHQFGVPVWGGNRPDMLVWLAVDEGENRYLVGANSDEIMEPLNQAAFDAGMGITLPLFDLEDQKALGFNDVWAGFSDQILRASTRYNAKQILFGQLLKTQQSSWRIRWTLITPSNQYADLVRADNADEALKLLFFSLAEKLADVYAPYNAAMESMLAFEISGINGMDQFAQVTQYLSSLDMVKTLNWNQITGDFITLDLVISGDVSVLKDIIALNNTLILDIRQQLPTLNTVDSVSPSAQQKIPTIYYRAN
ncbi:MAG: DUF2066 domain-containing protein [Porticoccaceae bacterium]|nr:DUF2066 domain-containing protein [Porticoccaceae bacterium]